MSKQIKQNYWNPEILEDLVNQWRIEDEIKKAFMQTYQICQDIWFQAIVKADSQ